MNNRITEAFDQIRADEEMKKAAIDYLHQTARKKQRRKSVYRKWALAAACFAIVLLGGQGYAAYFTPVSAISVDVNPSIELSINRFDKVISTESYNSDGDILLQGLAASFSELSGGCGSDPAK